MLDTTTFHNDDFDDPMGEILTGAARADISHAGMDLETQQVEDEEEQLWDALRESHRWAFPYLFEARLIVDTDSSMLNARIIAPVATAPSFCLKVLRRKWRP